MKICECGEPTDSYKCSLCQADESVGLAPKAGQDEPAALMVVKGEICYKSIGDDQSHGMWCPVNYNSEHLFPDGTKFYTHPQRTWARLMRGVRVQGDTVVISVKGGNAAARELCGALIEEMNK